MLKQNHVMKKIGLALLLLWGAVNLGAQNREVFRAEGVPFNNRHDARVGADYVLSNNYIAYSPSVEALDGATIWMGQKVEIPFVWTDGLIFFHLESVGQAYRIELNGEEVAYCEDGFTPAEYDLTPFVRQGENHLRVGLCAGTMAHTQQRLHLKRDRFAGSYLFAQQMRSVADYEISLQPDSLRRFGVLKLNIVARNGYNYEERVNVAYDIYSPEGKLMDFTDHPMQIEGRGQDTVRLTPLIYHTNNHKWGHGKAPLYRVMLFTKRDGKMWDYMPLQIGFSDMEYREGQWYRFGEPYHLREAFYDADADIESTRSRMEEFRRRGINTLRPSFPQPHWYYDLADELGLYVIDRAAISAFDRRNNRKVGGTPANDPAMVEEFIRRVKAMYYRSRNHTSVIGFSIANPSGNGYALYKAYEWLKSVEQERPVFYEDADGEWNSD